MIVEKLSNELDVKAYLKELGVDGGGVNILSAKSKMHLISIKSLHVGAANILKQDALSIGADLAVPRGTVLALTLEVDCLLIATSRELEILAKKELAQPFGLQSLALKLKEILHAKKSTEIEIMGVLNANDDSFYQASRFAPLDARTKIEKMIEDGADIIDIGGVSSRPNAEIVSVEEELARIVPIANLIRSEKLYERVAFSIDSYEPRVIEYVLNSGFTIVNDITGLEDDRVCKLCAEYDAMAIIMHMQGSPQTMQENPHYTNILSELYEFLADRVQKAESFGIKEIVVDVGVGFGKSLEDNLMLIQNLEHFLALNRRLLVGASRKSMIDAISPSDIEQRLAGTLAIHLEAYRNGASMVRVHDVYEHKQAIEVFKRLRGLF